MRPLILARRPSPMLAAGELTHIDRVPVDAELALAQWRDYVNAFRSRGWDVAEIEPADEHPDGVFVEDAVGIFGDLAVITSPGAGSRRGELATVRPAVDKIDLTVHRIELPGTLDGGDVLKVGRTAYVGRSARTNDAGVEQLRAIVTPSGWTVVPVPVTKVLHLKSAVTGLPDGTIIGRSENVGRSARLAHLPRGAREGGGYYGYKVHAAVDTLTGLPMAWTVETAKDAETTFALGLLDTVRERGFAVANAIMDKGYDNGPIHDGCMDRDICPVTPLRQTPAVKRGDHKQRCCEHGEWTYAGTDYKRQATKWLAHPASASRSPCGSRPTGCTP